jgi:hypothetical protein
MIQTHYIWWAVMRQRWHPVGRHNRRTAGREQKVTSQDAERGEYEKADIRCRMPVMNS